MMGLTNWTPKGLSAGCTIGEADYAARSANADEFARCPFLVRREHHAEGREHHIEAPLREGKIFRIGSLKRDRKSLGLGTLAAAIEQRRNVVGRYDISETTRCGKRGIAVTGEDIDRDDCSEHRRPRTASHRRSARWCRSLRSRQSP